MARPISGFFDLMKNSISINKQLEALCDIVTESHARIQKDFRDINPIVGVNQAMREQGVPADLVTIDCSNSDRRIILILHDGQPGIVSYQFSFKDKDPDENFVNIPSDELTADRVYDWIRGYFSGTAN